MPVLGFARFHETSQIDSYCKDVRTSFVSATPFVFAGPDPWSEIDELPASMPDDAVAYVYASGAAIRWVFIRIVDADHGWAEDIDYFFRDDGTLAKRERRVQSPGANIALEVSSYYSHGTLLKESSKQHTISRGGRDLSLFTDPEAPIFWTTGELPFPDIVDLYRRLG